jgi:hypothetical protein
MRGRAVRCIARRRRARRERSRRREKKRGRRLGSVPTLFTAPRFSSLHALRAGHLRSNNLRWFQDTGFPGSVQSTWQTACFVDETTKLTRRFRVIFLDARPRKISGANREYL